MHAAPPVRMDLAQDQGWRVFLVVCASTAAASTAAWMAQYGPAVSKFAAIAAISTAIAAGAAAWLWAGRRHATLCSLTWDGATWHWSEGSSAPSAGDVLVMVDLGVWLLLRFSPAPPSRRGGWLPVSRGAAGPQWRAWRAAVYARRRLLDPRSKPDRT